MKSLKLHYFLILNVFLAIVSLSSHGQQNGVLVLENDNLRLEIEKKSGAITSFYCKTNGSELIGEKRLAANFRISQPPKERPRKSAL